MGQVNIFRSLCQEFCPPKGGLVLGSMVRGCLVRGLSTPDGGGLVPGGAWSRGGDLVLEGGACSRGVWSQGGGIPACTEADSPLREAATAADRTHPTGMHSCFWSDFTQITEKSHVHAFTQIPI